MGKHVFVYKYKHVFRETETNWQISLTQEEHKNAWPCCALDKKQVFVILSAYLFKNLSTIYQNNFFGDNLLYYL